VRPGKTIKGPDGWTEEVYPRGWKRKEKYVNLKKREGGNWEKQGWKRRRGAVRNPRDDHGKLVSQGNSEKKSGLRKERRKIMG